MVLNDFVASAICSKKIVVLSDGSPWRPLIDVEDMALSIDWAIGDRCNIKNKFLICIKRSLVNTSFRI